jgi:pimeloyl-ACP methyl ester carboxylesterase
MPSENINGQIIEYESLGSAQSPTIVLIMGLGMQLISWPDAFCEHLVSCGFRVIRFDNRDIGLSGKVQPKRQINVKLAMLAAALGVRVRAPYLLDDMALDTVGLLSALKIDKAHIVGVSMGGMIAQLIAANHGERVLSLTSIMSSSGNRRAHRAKPDALRALMARPADISNPESIADHMVKVYGVIGSPGFAPDPVELRQRVKRNIHRSYYPAGTARQMLAIMASGDRRTKLTKITAPTLVIHGADDKLVPLEAGRDTARHINGAQLKIIPGMGHDLAPKLHPLISAAIVTHCRESSNSSTDQMVRSTPD